MTMIIQWFRRHTYATMGQFYQHYIIILLEAFTHADPQSAKNTDNLIEFLRFWDLRS